MHRKQHSFTAARREQVAQWHAQRCANSDRDANGFKRSVGDTAATVDGVVESTVPAAPCSCVKDAMAVPVQCEIEHKGLISLTMIGDGDWRNSRVC